MDNKNSLGSLDAFGTSAPKIKLDEETESVLNERHSGSLGRIDAFGNVEKKKTTGSGKNTLEEELSIFADYDADIGALGAKKQHQEQTSVTESAKVSEKAERVEKTEKTEKAMTFADIKVDDSGSDDTEKNELLGASIRRIMQDSVGSVTEQKSDSKGIEEISKAIQEQASNDKLGAQIESFADDCIKQGIKEEIEQEIPAQKNFFNFDKASMEDDIDEQSDFMASSDDVDDSMSEWQSNESESEFEYEPKTKSKPDLESKNERTRNDELSDPFNQTFSQRVSNRISQVPRMVDRLYEMDTVDTINAVKGGWSRLKRFTEDKVDRAFDFNKNKKLDKMFEGGDVVKAADFEFLRCGNELMLYRYNGISTRIVIPSCVANLPVHFIHTDFVYKNCFSNYKSRGKETLYSAENIALASRELKKSMKGGIEDIVLPNTLKSIPGLCFLGCEQMTNIVIPESVVYVAANAFSSSNLQNIYFNGPCPNGITEYSLRNYNVFVRKEYACTFQEMR